jgi:outer membrane protein OmpA-like peptidoglycan-associated protein
MRKYTAHLLAGLFVSVSACKTIPPQITRFDGTPSIVRGEKGSLFWDVTPSKNLQSVMLKNLQDSLPLSGKAEVKPNKAQQYELTIRYKYKKKVLTDSRTFAMKVEEPEATFKGQSLIDIGDVVTLDWKLPHFAQNVCLSEWVNNELVEDWDDMPSHATYQVKPLKDAVYKIEYLDEGALKVLEHSVRVTPAFFTGTKRILAGEEVQLIWKTNPKVNHVSLEKRENSYTREILEEHLPHVGLVKLNPTYTTEYLLSIIDEHHTTLIHKVDVVQGIFTGQRMIKEGETAYLSWRVTPLAKKAWVETTENKETVVLYNNLEEEGQMEVKPQKTTNYVLAVETKEGISRYEHTVRVTSPHDAGIYTQASPVQERYNVSNTPQIHHKGLSSLDDSPVTVEPHQIVEAPSRITFDFEQTTVGDEYKTVMNALVEKLRKDPNSIAEIAGHADLKGTMKGCDKISNERAENVKRYLVAAGIPEYRIITKHYGRMFPINYQQPTEELARENRRVEIVILK